MAENHSTTCRKCGELKPLSEFYFRTETGKYRGACKACEILQRRCERPRTSPYGETGRTCSACGAHKPFSDFFKRGEGENKYQSRCKVCVSARIDRAAYAERALKWHRDNIERSKKNKKLWRESNPDHARMLYQADPTGRLASNAEYRARKRGAIGRYSGGDVKDLLKLQRNQCAVCRGKLKKYHVDHIVALINGGSNDRSNLQILCPTCNIRKHARDPVEFMQEQGYLL